MHYKTVCPTSYSFEVPILNKNTWNYKERASY